MLVTIAAAALFIRFGPPALVHTFESWSHRPRGQRFYDFPSLSWPDFTWMMLAISLTTYACSILNNYALFKIDLFYVATLNSMSPIWALLLAVSFRHERPSWHAWAGSVLAVLGVVILVHFGNGEAGTRLS